MAGNANFATWNRLANVNPALSYSAFILDKGNTRFRGNTGGTASMTSTISMTSGKWYIEFYVENNPAGGWPTLGLTQTKYISELQNVSNYQTSYNPGPTANSEVIGTNGNIKKWGASSSVSSGSGWSDTDIVQIAYDGDSGKWWFGKNNTWYASGNPATGANPIDTITAGTELSVWTASYSGSSYLHMNAGQDDTFNGSVTAAGNADGNGYGAFKYPPPSGYLALCSANMSISSDIDPAGDAGATDNPTKQFGIVTYTGSSTSAQTITGLGFKPDLVWAKMRNSSQRNFLTDTNRGIAKHLFSDATSAEETDSSMGNTNPIYTAFNDDGFVFGTSGSGPNDSGRTYVAWCWKAGGAPTADNSAGAGATPTAGSVKIDGSNLGSALAGSIPATRISANTKGGFSIITYTGTGSNATIAHGLSAKPDFFTIKNRDGGTGMAWATYHSALGATKYLEIDAGDGAYSGSTRFNDTEPTTSTIGIGTISHVNSSGSDYVCYAWHSVEGSSKFGSYEGNANANGPFIYTGFRPRLIFIKKSSASNDWVVTDTARNTHNPASKVLRWEDTAAETSSNREIDILSNGFKLRTTNDVYNGSGGTYIYGAWGDVPFRYNNTF